MNPIPAVKSSTIKLIRLWGNARGRSAGTVFPWAGFSRSTQHPGIEDGLIRSNFKIYGFLLKLLKLKLMNDLVAAFNEFFEVIDADSPELLRDVFRVRYQVLCVEQRAPGFEPSNYPDKMESDDYDRHSSHILLVHRPSGAYVGTSRLILADPLDTQKPFPTERYTLLDPALIDMSKLPRQRIGEISRLFVLRQFCRRREELEGQSGLTDLKNPFMRYKRRFPHPVLALAVGIIRMSVKHNVDHWLSVMEPALNRLLGLYGLQLDPVGPLTEHHGKRRPYYINLTSMLDRMYKDHNQIWELVTDYGRVRPEQGRVTANTVLADR